MILLQFIWHYGTIFFCDVLLEPNLVAFVVYHITAYIELYFNPHRVPYIWVLLYWGKKYMVFYEEEVMRSAVLW